jgi:hypothetical protein
VQLASPRPAATRRSRRRVVEPGSRQQGSRPTARRARAPRNSHSSYGVTRATPPSGVGLPRNSPSIPCQVPALRTDRSRMKIFRRCCIGAALLAVAACDSNDDETAVTPPVAASPPGAITDAEQCTSQPGSSRYSLCGRLVSATVAPTTSGTAIIGSTGARTPSVRTETHILQGEFRAN